MPSRRRVLAGLGLGFVGSGFATGALSSTGAFSQYTADRDFSASVAAGSDALLGVVGQGPVKKNDREAMVEFTNNTTDAMSITVTLDTCTDGTLYDNEGNSGCSVTLSLAAGNAQFVDINASVTGTITYSISVSSSSLAIETAGSVEAESGNVKGAVRIKKPVQDKDFTADRSSNVFAVDQVDIVDDDGDSDLDRIEFRVREGGGAGTVVGAFDETNPPGDQYSPKGKGNDPAVSIQPESGYTITANTTYALTVTGYDADGNFTSETVEDTT
ncbi:MAG: hypothetical protein ABEH35_02655 [Haloarculaceae archaeon]